MKLNNKGFAISVVVYSIGTIAILTLLLILSVDSGMRKNTVELADNIKDELNEANKVSWTFAYTGDIEKFTVPKTATYQIEVWGAEGGSVIGNSQGGMGAYASINVYLTARTNLYIGVGGIGKNSSGNYEGGFNGGGDGGCSTGSEGEQCGMGGGGATHVATSTGLLETLSGNKNNILVVAAGGGGGGQASGIGGAGGGPNGQSGFDTYHNKYDSSFTGTGGTNANPGCNFGTTDSGCGKFGVGGNMSLYDGNYGGAGGGGGYFGGGGSGRGYAGAGGGSSYTSSAAIISNPLTISGELTMPTHDKATTMVGNSGNGYVLITRIS